MICGLAWLPGNDPGDHFAKRGAEPKQYAICFGVPFRMNKIGFYTKNIAFAAFLGCLIGMAFFAIIGSGWHEQAVKYGTYALTVLVSLLASAIAIGGVLLNLDKQRELVERKHIAARSVLPLSLSRLHKLTESGFETVLDVPELRNGPREEALQRFQNLRIPSEDIQQIRECIEAADPPTQAWLSLILAHWQLETSRLESTLFDENLETIPRQLANSAIDWLTIRAMIIHLFDYSRTGRPPNSNLKPDYIVVPILSHHLHSTDLADARTRVLEYINEKGGWSFKGFQSRFLSSSDDVEK